MQHYRDLRVPWGRGPSCGSLSLSLTIAVMFLLAVDLSPAVAQEGSQERSEASAESEESSLALVDWDQAMAARVGQGDEAQAKPPEVPCVDIADPQTLEDCWAGYRAYFSYYQAGFEHRRNVFWWQHVSTRIIFAVVLVLVAAGMYFAWMQFQLDLRRSAASGEAAPRDNTELELATSGIKVRSSVLGVIILVISLAFFYLFLVHVYPITELL